ncbi:MAG TPA: type II toxin-antitoxin system VapC family toxin [Aquabacterium sp.]|nr:type II toxin-antitoxin system VapC family toxin [Aquabacterium sp.]
MLDTNIASAIIAGRVDLDERLETHGPAWWCISAITRAELRFGVMRRPEATKLARLVDAFLVAARTEPFDARAADEFGRLRAELEGRGGGIGVADELIAAHALSIGAVIVTDNERHFSRVPRLSIENWLRRPPASTE